LASIARSCASALAWSMVTPSSICRFLAAIAASCALALASSTWTPSSIWWFLRSTAASCASSFRWSSVAAMDALIRLTSALIFSWRPRAKPVVSATTST
jgi:hypothetical protein